MNYEMKSGLFFGGLVLLFKLGICAIVWPFTKVGAIILFCFMG